MSIEIIEKEDINIDKIEQNTDILEKNSKNSIPILKGDPAYTEIKEKKKRGRKAGKPLTEAEKRRNQNAVNRMNKINKQRKMDAKINKEIQRRMNEKEKETEQKTDFQMMPQLSMMNLPLKIGAIFGLSVLGFSIIHSLKLKKKFSQPKKEVLEKTSANTQNTQSKQQLNMEQQQSKRGQQQSKAKSQKMDVLDFGETDNMDLVQFF
jgi:hypothetical protein